MKYDTSKPTVSKMPTLGKGTESIKKITDRGPGDYGSSARRLRVEGTEITGREHEDYGSRIERAYLLQSFG
jgi:hypothetical protein